MQDRLRLLLVEDTDDDAALVLRALRQTGFAPDAVRVQTAGEFARALDAQPELIICDYSLPGFGGSAALTTLREREIDIPFIVVSGTIDEESAVSILKAGAHDFVTKQNLARLGPAIRRELQEARNRAERREAQRQLAVEREALRISEEQFRQAQKMEAIGQLAGGIAHDFNNLLTAILGYSELLLSRVHEYPDIAEEVEEIRKAGERAGSLTRQLLAFSRKQVLHPRALDLNHVVEGIERMLRRLIGEDIELETITTRGLHRVMADPGQIEQVLINLAVNARDAMPLGGRLTIETTNATPPPGGDESRAVSPAEWVCLSVTDTGAGMSAEVSRRIFEPFFTTKGPGKGTGLGLSMVYGVVTQSGGIITVDSERERGTRFSIHLPAADQREEQAVGSPAVQADLAGTGTILLVEDEPAIRELVRKVLTGYGYAVLESTNVEHARSIAEYHPEPIDLLLSDIVMPRMSGPELAQRLVLHRPEMRVLYMSGFGSRLGTDYGSLSSSVALLHKPFSPQALARKVRESLGQGGAPTARPRGEDGRSAGTNREQAT